MKMVFGMFGGKKKGILGAAASAAMKEMNANQQGNLDFLEAAAAACALVAAVDGNVDSAERNKAIAVITKNKTIGAIFTGPQIEAIVNGSIDKASDSAGKQELIEELGDLKNNAEKGKDYAKACYLMAKDVANTDGSIGEREEKALSVLAGILGVNPADFAFDF
jgi:tellurite resistance protein TerB